MGSINLDVGVDDLSLLELDDYQLIRLGGDSAGSINGVYRFDLETGVWSSEGKLIEARQGKNLEKS